MTIVDLRSALPPIRDQGLTRGTCLAVATTTAHETGRDSNRGLASEALFWAAKSVEGNRQDGTTFRAVYQALKDHGQPDEDAWPYRPDLDITDASYAPPGGGFPAGSCHCARLRKIPAEVSAIRAELDEGNVVIAGLELWEAFELLDAGSLELPRSPDAFDGVFHVVAIVGYDDREGRLLVRNSWGLDWGENGYAWLPDDLVLVIACAAAIEELL